jgi:hypothetical protein
MDPPTFRRRRVPSGVRVRFPLLPVFRRPETEDTSEPTNRLRSGSFWPSSKGVRAAMVTEGFLNVFKAKACIKLCPWKNHFVNAFASDPAVTFCPVLQNEKPVWGTSLVNSARMSHSDDAGAPSANEEQDAKEPLRLYPQPPSSGHLLFPSDVVLPQRHRHSSTSPSTSSTQTSEQNVEEAAAERYMVELTEMGLLVTGMENQNHDQKQNQQNRGTSFNVFEKTSWASVSCQGPQSSFASGLSVPVLDLSLPLEEQQLKKMESMFSFNFFPSAVATSVCLHLQNPYPIVSCLVNIGQDYVPDFLLRSKVGVYIEQHEMPHVHRPLDPDASGFMLFARQRRTENSVPVEHQNGETPGTKFSGHFDFLFVKIPFGSCIYTPPFSWHADCFLTGSWEVLYSTRGNNRTLHLFRTKKDGGKRTKNKNKRKRKRKNPGGLNS